MAEVKITVRATGPYRVEADPRTVKLVDMNGNEWDLSQKIKDGMTAVSLCRCGASVTKPFCDGTHSKLGFQAAEGAVRQAEGGTPAPGVAQISGAPGQAAGDQQVPPPKPRTEM